MTHGDSQAAHRSYVNTHAANSKGDGKPSNDQRTPTRQMCVMGGSGSMPGVGLTLGPVSPRAPSNPAEPLSPGSPLVPCGCDREKGTIRTRPGWGLEYDRNLPGEGSYSQSCSHPLPPAGLSSQPRLSDLCPSLLPRGPQTHLEYP